MISKTTLSIVIVALLMGWQVGAEEKKHLPEPTWKDLTGLMGKKKDSTEFKAFLKKYGVVSLGGPQGTDNLAQEKGFFTIAISAEGVVTEVGVQVGYAHALPFNLKWGMALDQVKKALGKPSENVRDEMLTYKDKKLRVFVEKNGLDSVRMVTE